MLDIKQLLDIFTVLYKSLLDFGSIFTLTLREAVEGLQDTFPSISGFILNIIAQNSSWEIWDYQLIVLIIGTSGAFFIGFTLVKWLLDLIS